MKKIKIKHFLLFLGLIGGFYLLFHNVYFYPAKGAYDFNIHADYSTILVNQWRLPSLAESRMAYNPPLFYLLSGLLAKLINLISDTSFTQALGFWRYINIIFILTSLYLWHGIFKTIYPKNKLAQLIFILLIFSIPVLQKTSVMYTIEAMLLFTCSYTLWFFIKKYTSRPNLFNTLILGLLVGLNILTRISAITILFSIIIGILGLTVLKKINIKQMFSRLFILIIGVIVVSGGWFAANKNIYDVKKRTIPRERLVSYYTNIPFKFMMTYPLRLTTPLNQIIPIYYSTFWGDFWNYYNQRRFGITVEQRQRDKYVSTPERIKSLAWQNRINLPTTILMISGFFYLIFKIIKSFKKPDSVWLTEIIFLSLFISTWVGFLYMNTFRASWKGDSIKATYMLYILPIFIYMATIFLFDKLKKYKYIFLPTTVFLAIATVINLYWAWY